MTITFVIPTLNAAEYLEKCLQSIRNQTQPAEIIVVDGGSTDGTFAIANEYGCQWLVNPLKLAEFGLKQGILATKTDLVVVFAADNELIKPTLIAEIFDTFESFGVSALWGRLAGDEKLINKYYALIQNDPLCWFINNNLKNYIRIKGVFRVDPRKPLVWGANGLVYRTSHIKPIFEKMGYIGDNDAFQTMIESGKNKVAYFNKSFVIHHHCKSIRHCVSKWWRNHTQHYLSHKQERNMRWIMDKWFYPKLVLWVFYVPLLSFPHSLWLMLRDRNIAWLYHYPLSMCQLGIYVLAKLGVR